jgi:RecA-family ATPase
MLFGDEGAGKTTALVDLVATTAAGLPWLELPVARPLRWLLIENESAPGMFQRLLVEKRERWQQEAPWFDQVHVHGGEGLWGIFDFRQETHRQALWSYCREQKVDLVGVSPTFGVGGPGKGSPEETQAFVDTMLRPAGLWDDTGFVLVHHENKAGQVSGDWGRQPDTVVQFERDGDLPRTKLTWHKLRYSSELGERRRKQLLDWATEHKGFTVSDVEIGGKVSEETLYERLDAYLDEHAGAVTKEIKKAVTGTDEALVQLLKRGVEEGRYLLERKGSANLYSLPPEQGVRGDARTPRTPPLFEEGNPHG